MINTLNELSNKAESSILSLFNKTICSYITKLINIKTINYDEKR